MHSWHQHSDETVSTTPNLVFTSRLAHGSGDGARGTNSAPPG